MLGFEKTYTLPFKYNIPNYMDEFLTSTSLFQRVVKFLKRKLYIIITRQSNLEQKLISSKQKRILWINLSAISLGDSLMDLSSRILLSDNDIDLFTHNKNAHLYQADGVFNKIITNGRDINSNNYDLVIIDSYSTRSIKIKSRYLAKLPFVGMYGYYNGPEVNRVLFSFHKMNCLLNYKYDEEYIKKIAKNTINIAASDVLLINKIKLPNNFIAIVVGGEWRYRSYKNWHKVVNNIIAKDKSIMIVLIGSQNGKVVAEKIYNNHPNNIINLVAKFSFNQTIEIIKRASILLCCDGGLMHGANAVGTTILPLFAKLTPKMQLTDSIKNYAIFDKEDVNNIIFSKVYKQYTLIDK